MKKIGVCMLCLLVMMPLVFALEINIKAPADHRISLIIREGGKLTSLESHHKDIGTTGELTINSEISKSEIDLIVTLKKDGVNLKNKKFEAVSTDEVINIEIETGGDFELTTGEPEVDEAEDSAEEDSEEVDEVEEVESEENEEVVEESIVEEETQEVKKGIMGRAVGGVKSVAGSKTTYYIVGGIFVLGFLFFVIFIVRKKIRKSNVFKVKKLSDVDYEKRLEDAEKKIGEAKEELDDLKNRKKRLEDLRERYKKDQEELKKMGDGF